MGIFIFIIRALIVINMVIFVLLFSNFIVMNFGGIMKLKNVCKKYNIILFIAILMTIVLAKDSYWYEIKTNGFLFFCMIGFQLLAIRKQYENLEAKILCGKKVKFFATKEDNDAILGVVEIDGFWIEGFSEEVENFEKGKIYDDVSLFLEFDKKGRPRSLIVFR